VKQQFSASCKDQYGAAISCGTVSWASSNTGVATVTSAGLATGVAAGTATITATASGKTGSATLTVKVLTPQTCAQQGGTCLSATICRNNRGTILALDGAADCKAGTVCCKLPPKGKRVTLGFKVGEEELAVEDFIGIAALALVVLAVAYRFVGPRIVKPAKTKKK
jgi:hypothetical protein